MRKRKWFRFDWKWLTNQYFFAAFSVFLTESRSRRQQHASVRRTSWTNFSFAKSLYARHDIRFFSQHNKSINIKQNTRISLQMLSFTSHRFRFFSLFLLTCSSHFRHLCFEKSRFSFEHRLIDCLFVVYLEKSSKFDGYNRHTITEYASNNDNR